MAFVGFSGFGGPTLLARRNVRQILAYGGWAKMRSNMRLGCLWRLGQNAQQHVVRSLL